jgi:hypothetical protein
MWECATLPARPGVRICDCRVKFEDTTELLGGGCRFQAGFMGFRACGPAAIVRIRTSRATIEPAVRLCIFAISPKPSSRAYLLANLRVFLRRSGFARVTRQESLGVFALVLELECADRALHGPDCLQVPIKAIPLKSFARLRVHAVHKLSYDCPRLLHLHTFSPHAIVRGKRLGLCDQ